MKIIPEEIKYKCESEQELVAIISKINQSLQENADQMDAKDHPYFDALVLDVDKADKPEENTHKTKSYYEKLEPFKRIAMKHIKKNKKGSIEFLSEIVLELGHEMGEFSDEDFDNLLSSCGLDIDRHDEYLEQLKNLDIIYEPHCGRYRLI